MAEWARVTRTTISEYLRGEEKNIMSNQKILALMQSKGRVSTGHRGKDLSWRIRTSRNSMVQYGDADQINFDRVNRWREATLPWGGYIVSESVTKKEKLMNRGKEAIVNFISNLTSMMVEDIKYHFARELYLDGNAAGREESIHGFATWLGVTSNAQYTAPSDTYAGLSTVLGNYGGSVISGTWPTGKFDPEYYFWSPLVVNYTHADWAAAATWAASAVEVLRAGLIHSKNTKGLQGQVDLILMTASMYAEFLELLDDKERLQVFRDGEKSGLVALGFRDVVNFDGVDISYEVDVPDTEAFGINIDEMELCSLQGQLFVPGKDYDITTLSDQYTIDFFGQLKANPRAFIHWNDVT